MLTLEEERELDELLYEDEIESAKDNLLDFTKSTLEDFSIQPFHEKYYWLLNEFAHRRIQRLMISMPPQHGKSEGSTRRLPAFQLGLDPNRRIAVSSYSSTFASSFNRDIQRIIDSSKYHDIFPETRLNGSNVATVASNWLRNSEIFEVVDKKGALKSVGRGGALTGNKVDVMIMDDLYKDYMEGNSPIIRQAVWDWYTTVVKTRLHNDSQELIVFTRWHEEDLIGLLSNKGKIHEIKDLDEIKDIKLKENEWVKVNFEALKESDSSEIDPREKGEPLWPELHSKIKLKGVKDLDAEKFNCLYQGNPLSKKGLLYGNKFKTYSDIPQFKIVKAYIDTADTGTDKLCGIAYGVPLAESDPLIYVLDVIYTDEPMEITEPQTINWMARNKVNEGKIESNNGGRGFARVIEKGLNELEAGCHIEWFHQGANKEARIYSNNAKVAQTLVFPEGWAVRWSEFYGHVTRYKKLFKANKFDDAPDTMTGIIETEKGDQMFFF